MRVAVSAQSSISRCQSAELRANRETSRPYDTSLRERHLADQLLEAVTCDGAGSGLAEVAVDDTDALCRPARCYGAIPQRILPLRALTVLGNLAQRRLANIEIRIAPDVIGGYLEVRHGWAPR